MKKIVLVNGSPKIQSIFSGYLIDKLSNKLKGMHLILNISIRGRSFSREEKYEIINQSDLVILVVPVYSKALPSIVLEFLDGLEDYMKIKGTDKEKKLYCISHASALVGIENYNSLEVIKIFSEKAKGIEYYGGMGVGGGAYLNINRDTGWERKNNRDTREKLKSFIDIVNEEEKINENLYSNIKMNKIIYGIKSNLNWMKKGLRDKRNFLKIIKS